MSEYLRQTCLFLFILLFINGWLIAGSEKNTAELQQLKAGLAEAMEQGDSLQMTRQYRSIGVEYTYMSRFEEARHFLYKGLELAKALDNPRAIAAISNNLAECYAKLGDRTAALALYEEVGMIYLGIPDSVGYAGFLINLAAELQDMGENSIAMERAMLAVQVKEETGDSTNLAFFYNKLAELLENSHPERAREWLMKAYALIHVPKYSAMNTNISIYNNLGKIYRDLGAYESALAYYDSVYLLSSERGHLDGIEVGLSNQALIHARLGHTEKALTMHKQAIEVSARGQNTFRHTGHHINAGRLEFSLGRFQNALPLLKEGLRLSRAYHYPEHELQALESLSKVYRALGQHELALESYMSYTERKDSLDNLETRQIILDLERQYETRKKEQHIAFLETENQYHSNRRRIVTALLLMSLFFSGSLLIVVKQRHRRLLQQKQLSMQQQKIYRLSQENLGLSLDQKNRSISSMALQMAQKTQLLLEIRQSLAGDSPAKVQSTIRQIDEQLRQQDHWQSFRMHFEEVHPDFFKNLKQAFPALTVHEERMSAFLLLNLTTKEIASMSNITTAAVDKRRNRLRKKLEVPPTMHLKDFLSGI